MSHHKDSETTFFYRYEPVVNKGTLLNQYVIRSSSIHERMRANKTMVYKVLRLRELEARFHASLMRSCHFPPLLEQYT